MKMRWLLQKNYLPNPVTRFCTQELKIKLIEQYGKAFWDEFDVVLGLRADEHTRVSKMRGSKVMPLVAAQVTKRDVQAFWAAQNFDLRLPSINGTTPSGNCDLCFLKGAATIQGLMRMNPRVADWWIEQEAKIGATFRSDRPNYAVMLDTVQRQQVMDFGDRDQMVDCFCGKAA